MKTKRFIVSVMIAFISLAFIYAQMHDHSQMVTSKTETIKVQGNCDMCKTRIEKVVDIEGVSEAKWDKETKILILAYDPLKVSSDNIQKMIAAVGHDTDKYKADDQVYASLPDCCKYR
jgi:periplasmic mercuric ion binding protein